MAGRGYDVESADLVGAAPRFDQAGRDVTDALETLRSTLAGLGDHLGSDEQGQEFKAAYDPQAAEAERAVDGIGRAMSAIPPALRSTAEQYRADDAGARAAIEPQVRP